MVNNSDYNKPRTKLHELLPDVYQSDVTRSVFENLFNRFYSKNETTRVSGYIGKGNPDAVIKRQIREPTLHRQAFQVQPVLNAKIGTTEKMAAWYDLLNELERLGVDINRLPIWGSVLQFNWVPPIDLDKLINYQDYYWYDENNPNSRPDYITIKNKCAAATSIVNFWQQLNDTYGSTFALTDIRAADTIVTVTTTEFVAPNILRVVGNVAAEASAGKTVEISGTSSNNGTMVISSFVGYDQSSNTSTLQVNVPITNETVSGTLAFTAFDKVVVAGDLANLLEVGFKLYFKNSANPDLNNQVIDSAGAVYNGAADETVVFLKDSISNNIVSGVISIEEPLAAALVVRDCECNGSVGFDQTQWDDNEAVPLWFNPDPQAADAELLSDLLQRISSNTGPNLAASTGRGPDGTARAPLGGASIPPLWYDTTSDQLWQYGGDIVWNGVDGYTGGYWKVVVEDFSTVISNSQGNSLWDLASGCTTTTQLASASQWTNSNKWFYKTDIPSGGFNIAKRAEFPIIEFSSSLELNEWTRTDYKWKYRSSSSAQWIDATTEPALIELMQLDTTNASSTFEIVLPGTYGDQTKYFTPGKKFRVVDGTKAAVTSVVKSWLQFDAVSQTYRTHISLPSNWLTGLPGALVPAINKLEPFLTAAGDQWEGYGVHWVFDGIAQTIPVSHQDVNPDLEANLPSTFTSDVSGQYEYAFNSYVQVNKLTVTSPVSTFRLHNTSGQVALIGADDLRVYVGGVRHFGTYMELSQFDVTGAGDTTRVYAIQFIAGHIPVGLSTEVRVEYGPLTLGDLGRSEVQVRVSTDNPAETLEISLVKFRKVEQVKASINQMPLFDMYLPTGEDAGAATPIFTYRTSQDAAVQPALGIRLVIDTLIRDFGFEQYLISDDGNTLYAYRDYANVNTQYWVNNSTNKVFVWSGFSWTDKQLIVTPSTKYLVTPTVSSIEPTDPIASLNGALWLNLGDGALYQKGAAGWAKLTGVAFAETDPTIQTVWKKGLNNEHYTPKKVDWKQRSFEQYEAERLEYVTKRVGVLTLQGTSLNEATAQANAEFYKNEQNQFSANGQWVGDWEIPDPLYYNHLHENKKQVSYRELLTHFNSIIEAQPKIPGFAGPKTTMFHLIPQNQINFGIGGRIKEFNDGFDTFLSAIFSDTITPLTLIDFAESQYRSLLNQVRERFRSQISTYLTSSVDAALLDLNQYVTDQLIEYIEENDSLSLVYGDSTTFNDTSNAGIRNWIITLPYLGLAPAVRPVHLKDSARDLILHHDGHYDSYVFEPAILDTVIRSAVRKQDSRGNVVDTYGKTSGSSVPTSRTAFETSFASTIENREGVLWYQVSGSTRTLYRFAVIAASAIEPSSSVQDGTMWYDLTDDLLKTKSGVNWVPVTGVAGNIAAAWQVVDLNQLIHDTIIEIETRLFENAPRAHHPEELAAVKADKQLFTQYVERAFNDYVTLNEIAPVYQNVNYSAQDPFTWNYKYSTIGQAFEIVGVNEEQQAILVAEDQTASLPFVGQTVYVKNGGPNDGTWTISDTPEYDSGTDTTAIYLTGTKLLVQSATGVLYDGTLPSSRNTGAESGGDWRDLYQKFYGTAYPHLEPWTLQGYVSKPDWWDVEYKDNTNTRRWKPVMWDNIANGVLPAGATLPNGFEVDPSNPPALPIYNYFSVNITGTPVTTFPGGPVYNPDDLLPPYWPYVASDPRARSLFNQLNTEIVAPAADFSFGDAGPVEYEWRASSRYLYDQLKAWFQIDPVRYIAHTFGVKFVDVAGLQVDLETLNTFSHTRTNFHGDIVGSNEYRVNGTNQWYVDYSRYNNIDTSYSDFRITWTQWTAPLTYQLSSFIDSQSFILGHRTVDISPFDWRITAKKSAGVEDFWYDAFKINVLDMPPSVERYNNESQWRFELNTNVALGRTIKYYDVKNYQFHVDPTSDECSIYTYRIISSDSVNNWFYIAGDQTNLFTSGRTFDVSGTVALDGTYTITSSGFDPQNNRTIVAVDNITSTETDGFVSLNYRTLGFATGDRVFVTTNETLPTPLIDEREYFAIVVSPTKFKLAATADDAFNNIAIDLTTVGRRDHFVGVVERTFLAIDGGNSTRYWKHYQLDKTNILELSLPSELSGIQNIINLVDGYEALQYEGGWRVNEYGEQKDPTYPERTVSWQLEIERFIDYIFGIRTQVRRPQSSRYEVTVDPLTDEFVLSTGTSQFLTGTPVNVYGDNNLLPQPLLQYIKYYVIRTGSTTFKLAASLVDAERGEAIDITSSVVGPVYVSPAKVNRAPIVSFTLNPFRNGIVFRPPRGIVSNIIAGPTEDVRTSQLVFDQYGRAIGINNVRIYREDKQTMIKVPDGIDNDVELTSVFADPYNYLHLGGLHLFVDAYEHVLIFNNYTTEGQLLYDPFVGLNVTKYELQFRRQEEFTQRPNVGGYYLETFFNQNAALKRNIEASVEDLRYLYDTYTVPESETLIENSRKVLGYEGLKEYFNDLNLGPKSQFIFWRGMIQQKGSVNAIKAFINSRRYVDAKVDEFWAVKRAEFGAAGDKEYPAIYLTTADARTNDLRIDFVTEEDLCIPGYAMNVYDNNCGYAYPESGEPILVGADGYNPVLMSDTTRWYEQPDALQMLANNGERMYFTLKPIGFINPKFYVGTDLQAAVDELYDTPPTRGDSFVLITNETVGSRSGTYYRWNVDTQTWDSHGSFNEASDALPLIRHGLKADAVTFTINWHDPATVEHVEGITGNNVTVGTPYIPFANNITVFKKTYVYNAAQPIGAPPVQTTSKELKSGVDYAETLNVGGALLSNTIQLQVPLRWDTVVGTERFRDVIDVVYGPATLAQTLHYNVVNSDIIQVLYYELLTAGKDFKVFGLVQDDNTQNPAKIIDIQAGTVVTPVQIWDPARGLHNYNAIHNVDLQLRNDPARYASPVVQQTVEPGQFSTRVVPSVWGVEQVGTTWLDTTRLAYINYYDRAANQDNEKRLSNWGKLAGWGQVNVYEWVESDVHPSEWNALAEVEENDITIDERVRKSGRVYPRLFKSQGGMPVTYDRYIPEVQELDTAIEGVPGSVINPTEYTFAIDLTKISMTTDLVASAFDVYVNGIKLEAADAPVTIDSVVAGQVTAAHVTISATKVDLQDHVTFVRLPPTDQEVIDAGVEAGTMLQEYEYNQVTYYDEFNQPRQKYYFWVQGKTTKSTNRSMSLAQVEDNLVEFSEPYMFFQRLRDPVTIEIDGYPVYLPIRFSQVLVRGLRGLITADSRFILRFTRDYTLRDSLDHGKTPMQLKNKHVEWELIREEQSSKVRRALWDLITESIVGYKLTNPAVRIPSLSRELYDAQFGTDTRYGMGDDRAFANGELAKEAILSYLTDPNNDFRPIDINVFFTTHNFDTPAATIEAMDRIYTAFAAIHVNKMFFSVLHNAALSVKFKHPDIFKTSMIALHGVKPFQVGGLFDD